MNNNEVTFKIGDIINVFLKRMWIILLAAVLVTVTLFAYFKATYVEQYTSESTIMVMNPEDNLSASSSSYYYSLTITAVKDCQLLLTSRTVLYRIINELDLQEMSITYGKLKNMISIANYPDSHVLGVSVTSESPELSKRIVDLLCRIGAQQIESHIDFATAKVIDEGTLNPNPSNSVNVPLALICGVGVGLILWAIFFLIELNDDTIKNVEDIENELGLSVLGIVPINKDIKKQANNIKKIIQRRRV